ncbi:hypothetical protein HanIR_Chr08g0356691 [Helianthus annuus]|nr:hypothetical protein HanIR_Chr08g0356691 [Helianthus annuus]
MNVIHTVSKISSYLNPRHPIGKYRKARVSIVLQAIRETNTVNIIINQIYVTTRHRSSSKLNQTRVMTFTYHEKSLKKLLFINQTPEFPLEDDDVIAADDAAPGGGG